MSKLHEEYEEIDFERDVLGTDFQINYKSFDVNTITTLHEDMSKVLEELAVQTCQMPDTARKRIYEGLGRYLKNVMTSMPASVAGVKSDMLKFTIIPNIMKEEDGCL